MEGQYLCQKIALGGHLDIRNGNRMQSKCCSAERHFAPLERKRPVGKRHNCYGYADDRRLSAA
jgi:hypothetical protein